MNSDLLEDFHKQNCVYLHCDYKKFWEITLDQSNLQTTVRVGKLVQNNREEPKSVQSQERNHNSLDEARRYILDQILRKKAKGYEQLNNDLDEDIESVFFNTLSQEDGLKRKIQDLAPLPQTKKVLTNEEGERLKNQNTTSNLPLKKPAAAANLMRIGSYSQEDLLSAMEEERQDDNSARNFVLNPRKFKGSYLTFKRGAKTHFCKVQILESYVKIENGVLGDSKSHTTQYCIYKSVDLALKKAEESIREKLEQNYRIQEDLFFYDFKESESGLKMGLYSSRLPRSTPSSPSKTQAVENQAETNLITRKATMALEKMELEDIFEEEEEETKKDEEEFDIKEYLKKASVARSESRFRSHSPERKSYRESVESKLSPVYNETIGLGKAVPGIYDSLQMPQKWDAKKEVNGWYLSEKIESVRCFWDGTTFWSKKGKKYNAPEFFYKDFPESPLDGELYMGRNKSKELSAILQKKKPKEEDWNEIKFIVYDAPELKLPYRRRVERLEKVLSEQFNPYIAVFEYQIIKSSSFLMKELDRVEKEGGEGLVIRDPRGFYEKGKSGFVLEIDAFHYEEATIEGHEYGKGENEKLCTKLLVRNVYGLPFALSIGMTASMKKSPPEVGSKVTYRFKAVNEEGVPKHPSLVKIN